MSHLELNAQLVGAQYDFFDDDETKFLHLSAGYGFGKSTCLIYKALKLSMLNAPYAGGLVVPSFTDFTKDILPLMENILNDNGIKYTYHGTEHKFKFPWSSGYLYITSAEKKIRGPNWAYAAINELTLIAMERYREVIGRVRIKGAKFPQIVSSGTPEGIASPYYEIFVEKPWKSSKVLYGDTRENAHNLDPTYIQSLYDSYPKQLIDAYLKGLWVNMTGNRFYYSYDSAVNDITQMPNMDEQFHCALDFNVDPFCASLWQTSPGHISAVDEVQLTGGDGYKTTNMISALAARGYGPANTIIYPDPAGNSRSTKGDADVKVLRDYGFTVRVKSVAPKFRERQINANNLFEKLIIRVNGKQCPGLKRDLLAVEQDPITLEKEKKNPRLTHFSDGMDYMIDILYPYSNHRAKVIQTMVR